MADSPEVMVEYYRDREREKILAMQPGRELDLLIAKKVTGLVKDEVDENLFKFVHGARNYNYSTNIAAAWEAWTHNVPDNWTLRLDFDDGKYTAMILEDDDVFPGYKILYSHKSESAAEAMVKCRLLAVMGL